MTEAEKAYAFAEREIAEARERGETVLDFNHSEARALEVLPPEISDLTQLEFLALNGTRISDLTPLSGVMSLEILWLDRTKVSDISPLSGLTSLSDLFLDDTEVSDLTPLLALTRLESDPGPFGLSFGNCAAARADGRINSISKIKDPPGRSRELFAYLREQQAKPIAARSSHRPLADSAAQIGTAQIKAVLKDSYPDVKARAAHLVGLIQQQRAVHALIPVPNEAEPLEEYRAEEELLKTLEAGLVSVHEDLPEVSEVVVSDAEAVKLRDKLVKLAALADKAVKYLDADKGTYGGLWKIGLISAVGGVLALVPGVSFIAGAAISGATIGAQTVRLQVSRE